MEHAPKLERATIHFDKFQSSLEKFIEKKLLLSEILGMAHEVNVSNSENTWASSTRGNTITIGEQKIPGEVAQQFAWGTETKEEEYLVKLAHEYAHILQHSYDNELVRWLEGSNEVPEEAIPYIQLYSLLSQLNGLTGLSQLPVYHEQNRTTGKLDVPAYEDSAEAMGSYLIGTDYFQFRMRNARAILSEEQISAIRSHIESIIENWKKKHQPER